MKRRVWGPLLGLLLLSSPTLAQELPAGESPVAAGVEQGLAMLPGDTPYPSPDAGYVTDLADVLDREQEARIEQWLWQVEAKTGVEIAVVTIHSIRDYPHAANASIESFATGLFDAYQIGNPPRNDGVLLLVATRDRQARIELGAGYGRTRDADAMQIMAQRVVPQFKRERYAEGVTAGVRGIMREFAGVRAGVPWTLVGLCVAALIVISVGVSLFRNGKRGWGWVCVGLLIILVLAIRRSLETLWYSLPDRDTWNSGRGGGGGFGGGGFGGGGFGGGGFGGGFGGGSSGGGGATGSW